MWRLHVPIPTPSLNQIQGKHWTTVRALNQNMKLAVMVALAGVQVPKAEGKRKLAITRHGKGTLDADNLAGGCKGLIDALKVRGVIQDDSPAHLEVSFKQVVTKDQPFTLVVIEEAA